MTLFARMAPSNDPAQIKIEVHRFGAALREWADGGLTRAQVIAAFNLDAGEVVELDALSATYQAIIGTDAAAQFQRAVFLNRMEDVFILVESGDYPEGFAKTRLGF